MERRVQRASCLVSALLLAHLLAGCNSSGPEPYQVARLKQEEKQTQETMRMVQLAAERYAADHGGVNYPTKMDDIFKSYFPGGREGRFPAPVGIVNPYSGINEFPTIMTNCQTLDDVRKETKTKIPRGTIQVFVLEGGKAYAVVGGDHEDKMLKDEEEPSQPLIFSNRL